MMNKKIMICADDFGIAKNINLAIYELAQRKRISAISCIVMPESNQKDFQRLKSCKEQFLGLHFNLTHNFFRVKTNKQPSPGQSILGIYSEILKNSFSQKKIEIEFEKQWNRFCDLTQSQPDYLDSHHHIHQLPYISDAILNSLSRLKFKSDFFVRNTANIVEIDSLFLKKVFLNFFGKKMRSQLKKSKIETNKNFTGFYDYKNQKMSLEIVYKFLQNIKDDTMMMVHPALGDTPELDDLMSSSRKSEFSLIMSDDFMDLIKKLEFSIELKQDLSKIEGNHYRDK